MLYYCMLSLVERCPALGSSCGMLATMEYKSFFLTYQRGSALFYRQDLSLKRMAETTKSLSQSSSGWLSTHAKVTRGQFNLFLPVLSVHVFASSHPSYLESSEFSLLIPC